MAHAANVNLVILDAKNGEPMTEPMAGVEHPEKNACLGHVTVDIKETTDIVQKQMAKYLSAKY